MTSPLMIEIGLHYHAFMSDYRDGDFGAPAVKEAIAGFLRAGLLKPTPGGPRAYEPTEGMRVWVEALCAVPWPEQVWRIPDHVPGAWWSLGPDGTWSWKHAATSSAGAAA